MTLRQDRCDAPPDGRARLRTKLASVTLAVCTHNRAASLARTLGTISRLKAPSISQVDVVVVDNASTDGTANTARRLAGTIPFPCRVVTEKQLGLSFARRTAIESTRAEWVAFIDDDCELEPLWLVKALLFVARRPRAGAVGARIRVSWQGPVTERARRQAASFGEVDVGAIPFVLPDAGHYGPAGAGLLVRRAAVDESAWANVFRLSDRSGTHLASGGDTELIAYIRGAGYEVWYAPGLRVRHIIPAERTSDSYLCRLHFGFGLSQPYLDHLVGAPTDGRGSGGLRRETKALLLTLLRWARALPTDRTGEFDARLELLRRLGRIIGWITDHGGRPHA